MQGPKAHQIRGKKYKFIKNCKKNQVQDIILKIKQNFKI